MNCSENNIDYLEECGYNPDDNIFTMDEYPGFTSVCVEGPETYTCTTEENWEDSITHTCSLDCNEPCMEDSDCAPTVCADGCHGRDYYDYEDEEIANNYTKFWVNIYSFI